MPLVQSTIRDFGARDCYLDYALCHERRLEAREFAVNNAGLFNDKRFISGRTLGP